MNTIHLLTNIDPKSGSLKSFKAILESAKALDYTPDSLETLSSIDYMDRKILLLYNQKFYNAAIALCGEIISTMIKDIKRHSRKKCLKNVRTLDDLLNCGYYFDDYESSRREFATVLCEDYLGEI